MTALIALAFAVETWSPGFEEERGGEEGGGRLVTRAKNARSDFNGGQGRQPRRPMPRVGVVATIRVRGGRGGIGGEGDIVGWVKYGKFSE